MNNNRHFDEHIKEQLGKYTPDVPPDIWEKIVAEKDKKRPAGFWVSMFSNRNKLLLIGLIIALSSGGALFYYNKFDQAKENTNEVTESKKINTKTNTKEGTPSTEFSSDKQATVNELTNKSGKTDEVYPGSNAALGTNAKTRVNITSPLAETDADAGYTAGKGRGNKKYYTGLGNVLVNTTEPVTEEDESAGQGGTLLGRLTFNAEKITEKRKSGKEEKPHFNPVVFLPGCPTIEKDASGNKRYFEFYAGPDYAIRSLQDTGNSSYLQKRKESTKFKSGFSAGIRYTKVFNNSMSVRGGVNYSQINEKFTFSQGNVVQVTYIINNNGDTIGSYTTTGSRYKTTINRYRSIDIPLVLGYEVGNGKLHANINAGAIVNIYSWQKGDVLDAAGNPVSITTGKSSSPYQFKTNAGVGFIGAVSVYYKLNNRLHIMAEPYFRYNLTPMNKESITLKQKYQTAGLRLGIRLDLK
ncbi:MAG: hypothetical protein ACKOU7_08080 [Ferruginibacter sp.]